MWKWLFCKYFTFFRISKKKNRVHFRNMKVLQKIGILRILEHGPEVFNSYLPALQVDYLKLYWPANTNALYHMIDISERKQFYPIDINWKWKQNWKWMLCNAVDLIAWHNRHNNHVIFSKWSISAYQSVRLNRNLALMSILHEDLQNIFFDSYCMEPNKSSYIW